MTLQLKPVNVNGKEYQVPALYQTYGNGTNATYSYKTYIYTWLNDHTNRTFTITCNEPAICNSEYISIISNSRGTPNGLTFNESNNGSAFTVICSVDKIYGGCNGCIINTFTDFTGGSFETEGYPSLRFHIFNKEYPVTTTFWLIDNNGSSNTITGTITVKIIPFS
jgi:hypothetical protein